ncbi:hypothetical protein UNPA324_20525 [Bradyrhizobium sp. UNPA324]|nr:hypothetical protein UNPA324_20525 [Bradyrhizobium sp. UNPA324]
MGGSLSLIHFAFCLEVLVSGKLASPLFDRAFCLVGGALHMFTVHDRYLSYPEDKHNEIGARSFLRDGHRVSVQL